MKFLAVIIIVSGVVLDQLHKWFMLDIIDIDRLFLKVTTFFNLVYVKNTGISFGMFANHPYGQIIFAVISSIIVMVLLVWLYKTNDVPTQIGLSLMIGGAIGNIIDRVRIGGVSDFFDFHAGGYHFPAFNIADSLVFLGAMLLLSSSFRKS